MREEIKEVSWLLGVSLASALLAGGFCTGVQQAQAIPLIIDAEAFEVEEIPAIGTIVDRPVATAAESEEWFPNDGAERHVCTFLANMLVMWGYSLMLLGVFVARGSPVGGIKATTDILATLRGGICWGCCGFVVFGLAPGLNLPPELPGMVAAELVKRQGCWFLTSFMTCLGLAFFYVGEPTWSWKALAYLIGILCLLTPHLIGSPEYDHMPGASDRPPPELAAQFTTAALIAQALSWVFLGMVVAFGHNMYFARFGDVQEAAPMAEDSVIAPSTVGSSGGNENKEYRGENDAI
jgi:cobalt transporter subunit CbtA